jgi:hypothetical protein
MAGEFTMKTPGHARDSSKCEHWGFAAALLMARTGVRLRLLGDNIGTIIHFNAPTAKIWSGVRITAHQQVNRNYGPVKTFIECLLEQTFKVGDAQPIAIHVKSHQDDTTSRGDLSLDAQKKTIRADGVADGSRSLPTVAECPDYRHLLLAGQPNICLHWHGEALAPFDNKPTAEIEGAQYKEHENTPECQNTDFSSAGT